VHWKLRELYDLCKCLSREVQALPYDNVAEDFEWLTWVNKNWIAIHEPLIKADLRREEAAFIKAGVCSIRQYLISLVVP
jgi:hypothetical protein